MIETIVRDHLTAAGFPSYMEVPENPEAEYLLIEKTGSSKRNTIRSAAIAIQCVSRKSLFRAAQMCDQVIDVMEGLADEEEVFGCKLVSDYNYTNTETKEYRYQAIFTINY